MRWHGRMLHGKDLQCLWIACFNKVLNKVVDFSRCLFLFFFLVFFVSCCLFCSVVLVSCVGFLCFFSVFVSCVCFLCWFFLCWFFLCWFPVLAFVLAFVLVSVYICWL